MEKKAVIKFIILRTIGNFLVLFMIFGFFATFGPALYYESLFRIGINNGVRFKVDQPQVQAVEPTQMDQIVDQKMEGAPDTASNPADSGGGFLDAILSGDKEQILRAKSPEFSILIPKIGASERVFPNVDPSNEDSYIEVLKAGVAHAQGSAFPGMDGNTYLFAHSADNFWNVGRYNAVFYLLKELQPGDDITVVFEGKRHDYKVIEQKIVDAEDTSNIDARLGEGEQLTLQTCWPPGTTWKRLLIIAKPVK